MRREPDDERLCIRLQPAQEDRVSHLSKPVRENVVTKSSKYFPSQSSQRSNDEPITRAALERAGIISSDPNAKRAKPAGSSPALRIACPVCYAPAGSYCTKPVMGMERQAKPERQTIAHKKRREEEERTR